MIGSLTGEQGPVSSRCSRARCSSPAVAALRWRNPRIHAEGRVKTWLACDEHRAELESFLTDRGFPVEVAPFTAADVASEGTP